jgi:HEAT repeat protein
VLPNDAIAVAAAWGVARLGDGGVAKGGARAAPAKTEPLLTKLLSSAAPEVRAIAAIGLGLTRDRKHAPALAALARSPDAGPVARAAAIHALGELGAGVGAAETALFTSLADSSDSLLRQAALLTLARVQPARGAEGATAGEGEPGGPAEAIAAGAFSSDDDLRAVAAAAGVALAKRTYPRSREPLPVPDGALTLKDILGGLGPDAASPADRAAALIALGPALRRAAVAAVSTSPERAQIVAEALLARAGDAPARDGALPGKPGAAPPAGARARAGARLAPFLDGAEALDPAVAQQVAATVDTIAAAVVTPFVSLVRHPAIEVRTRAVELLAARPEPEAQAAVIDALGDPEESVRRAALSAIGGVRHAPTIAAVAGVVRGSTSWPLRVRAAEALGRLGQGAGQAAAFDTLSAAARGDAYALVREAAARALASADRAAAAPLLRDLAARDAEPSVRQAAAELLRGQP